MSSVINGVKTKKIAYKISKQYFTFAIISIILAAPICHYFTKIRYEDGIERILKIQLKSFRLNVLPTIDTSNILLFNSYNEDLIQIEPDEQLRACEFKKIIYYNNIDSSANEYYQFKAPIFVRGVPYTLYIRQYGASSKSFIINTIILFTSIILFLIMGLLIINSILSRKLGRDLDEALDLVEKFGLGEPPSFHTTDIEEFARFMDILRIRMQKNREIYNAQKEFVENAAHELQTPLSVFQGKVDMLAQDPEINKKQTESIAAIQDSISRMNKLNRNLLLLSKIEHQIYEQEQWVNINEYIHSHWDFFMEQAEQKNIQVTLDEQDEFIVQANLSLTEVMICNLFMNAISHNVRNGIIDVVIKKNSILICNTGINKAMDEETLWNRLFKSSSVESRMGLGLSIIKKIVDLNKWNISYRYEEMGKHFFKITI